jgi:hypothetical protein
MLLQIAPNVMIAASTIRAIRTVKEDEGEVEVKIRNRGSEKQPGLKKGIYIYTDPNDPTAAVKVHSDFEDEVAEICQGMRMITAKTAKEMQMKALNSGLLVPAKGGNSIQ